MQKMGSFQSRKPANLTLSKVVTSQTIASQSELVEDPLHHLAIISSLISYQIEPVQVAANQVKIEAQSLSVIPLSESVEKPPELAQNKQPSQKKEKRKEKIYLRFPVTIGNFEEQLKGLWLKDPTMPFDHFFKISLKVFAKITEPQKEVFNLNKKWLARFVKTLKEIDEEVNQEEAMIPASEKNNLITETYYEQFSEPESAQIDLDVATVSQEWKRHTWKLLETKYPKEFNLKKTKKEPDDDILVVNQSMVKTLERKKSEMNRLKREHSRCVKIQ